MAATPSMLHQALRFGVVGTANTVVTLAILWGLRDGLGWPVWVASATGYAVGIIQSYLLNRGWTFAGGVPVPVGRQMLRFLAVNIVCGLIFSGLTSLAAPGLGVRIGSLVALVPVTLLSFVLQRRYVFGSPT